MQHQAAMAERNRIQQQRVNERVRRDLERKAAAAQRAAEKAARADAREQAAAEREAKRLYAEARQAEADSLTAEAEAVLEEYDRLLAATLEIDDFVDLEKLRQSATPPRFESEHSTPLVRPDPIPFLRPRPVFVPPDPPSGLFGRKKHADDVVRHQQVYAADIAQWQLEERRYWEMTRAWADYEANEPARVAALAADRRDYEAACRDREARVSRENAELDELIREFRAGTTDGVEEYFSIVLQNSAYPEDFPLGIAYDVDVTEKEMTIYLDLPRPDQMPTVKAHKYVRARDEIDTVALSQKEQRDRYASMLYQVCVRTLHELFESDRADHLHSVSLTAGVTHVDPATGNDVQTHLLSVAAAKPELMGFNLHNVDPGETLRHIGAVISKNPAGLTPISDASGARTR